jgi:hypothetical protein
MSSTIPMLNIHRACSMDDLKTNTTIYQTNKIMDPKARIANNINILPQSEAARSQLGTRNKALLIDSIGTVSNL